MTDKSDTKRSLVFLFISWGFFIASLAVILVPLAAYVVSQRRSSQASNATSKNLTCFPSVPEEAAPVARSLIQQNVSREQLLKMIDIIRNTHNLDNPEVLQSTMTQLGFPLVRALQKALNASDFFDLYQKARREFSLFQASNSLFCHEDTVADLKQKCCYFSCPNWNWYSTSESTAATVLLYTSISLGIIMMFTMVLVLLKLPKEREFPNVVFYYIMTVHFAVSLTMCSVRWISKDDAICCNERNQLNAVAASPCGGTYVETAVEQYGGICLALWWASAVFNVWLPTLYPQKAALIRTKKVFFVESFVSWILPLFAVGFQFFVKKSDTYKLQPFCHYCMAPDNQLLYFFYILPGSTVVGVAGVLISSLFFRKYRTAVIDDKYKSWEKDPLLKAVGSHHFTDFRFNFYVIAIFFLYIWNLVAYVFATFGSDDIESAVRKYFMCAANAFSPERCVRGGEAHYSTVFVLLVWPVNVFTFSVLGMFYLFSSPEVRKILVCKS